MTKGKDLNDLVVLLGRAAPDLPPARLQQMARQIQADIGGGRIYVKKAPAEGKAFLLGRALAAGASLEEAFNAAGCSRTHGFRLLRRRWIY